MNRECQNCKSTFVIEGEDLQFYKKMEVPAPTWCPHCRMMRRFSWYNYRNLSRKTDAKTGREIFTSIPAQSDVKIYERDYWWSDDWDPMEFGREYDFSRSFIEQFRELMHEVPWASRSAMNLVNSDYSAMTSNAKNSYLCFTGDYIENSAYCVVYNNVKEGFDLYESRHNELCYDSYMVDEAYRVFYSINCEECTDVWFSRNMTGCSDCFGCINLRNKKNHIFNKQVSKEDYNKFIDEFNSGSFKDVEAMRKRAEEFWMNNPKRFTLVINVENSTGEHIERTKNVKESYSVHESENLKYCQLIERTTDSYDFTRIGNPSSMIYESVAVGLEADNVRFSFLSVPSVNNIEYSVQCMSCQDLFGCVGIRKKKYCILNKQYTKEDYADLVKKIREHMDEMPYTDKMGRVYKYGEFFPSELSPFAYNETISQDLFPLTKEQALEKGYLWRDKKEKNFRVTIKSSDLPDDIEDAGGNISKELIECGGCGDPYQIIPMELEFYRRMNFPIPRTCPECRFQRRLKFVNPPKFWERKCQCAGIQDDSEVYQNDVEHFHGAEHCPNEFRSSFEPNKPDIVYCEECYKSETI